MPDTVQRGVVAGILGIMVDIIVHGLAFLTLGTTMTGHYIHQLIFPFSKITGLTFGISEIAHFIAGALIGIFIVLIFKYFGSDYPYLKGIGFSVFLWVVHVAFIPNLVSPNPRQYLHRTEMEAIVDLIAHIAYGFIVTMYLIKNGKRIAVR
ncbi:MAG: hypothetical protein PHT78_05685 [Desulfitobacteriaceae bacterium]|nr:hypothetical protein [Desulfitobacteriaceae bacterium]MDD4752734.1 hypothetical protein [Desulfitobacteriaceae bacterium]